MKSVGFFLFVFILTATALQHCAPVDDSDMSRWNRSGLVPHIDQRTGCHYLSRTFGGPTPRLDRDGKQVCEVRR